MEAFALRHVWREFGRVSDYDPTWIASHHEVVVGSTDELAGVGFSGERAG
jgi:hypothetical protein